MTAAGMKKWAVLMLISLMVSLLCGCGVIGDWMGIPKPEIPSASKVLDSQGREIASLFEQNRVPVKLNQISPYMTKAIVAIEDARFYEHMGLDPIGIARAMLRNLKAGSVREGGSTITQQTAKNLYLGMERTWTRKIREAVLTIQLERRYTKDEILDMYLNQIYFGHGAYGVEVAAQTFFAKPASELNLAESALLAGIPKGPNIYSPYRNFSAAKKRQLLVLQRMVELGKITQAEADKAAHQTLVLATSAKVKTVKAPYFIDEVRRYITDKYENGAELLLTGGLTIQTTLDLAMQNAAETAFVNGLNRGGTDLQGALVAVEPTTGFIKAMVGGKDYKVSKYNRVFAKRQPGSAFKPFSYAAAMETGFTPGSIIKCEPVTFHMQGGTDYTPTDSSAQGYHYRNFTLDEALIKSDNVVSVRLNQQVTPQRTVDYAKRLGITSQLKSVLSIVLGTSEVSPLEMAGAYATLANQGNYAKPFFILKILDRNGRVLEQNNPQVRAALDAKTAYLITDMLRGVLQPGGTAATVGAQINRPAAGKTGTTQNYRDAWFVGFTPQLSAAIYVGYDKPRPTGQTGGTLAAPIWAEFVQNALANQPAADFTAPQGVVKVRICGDSGQLATPFSEQVFDVAFIAGTEPTSECPVHSSPLPIGGWFWGTQQPTPSQGDPEHQVPDPAAPERQQTQPETQPTPPTQQLPLFPGL
ncbi:MAG TPA: PBP1A family penicillin-binding protein [Bacillota bacterium]|nr:PBP1A family penicillin-binding protein [Bacillota bacterium]